MGADAGRCQITAVRISIGNREKKKKEEEEDRKQIGYEAWVCFCSPGKLTIKTAR